MFRNVLLAAFGGILLTLPAAPASATFVCDIQRTPDGFVALRAGPSAQARLIARMQPGQMVLIGQRRSGNWTEVTHWSDGRVPVQTEPRFREGRPGWVHRRLIEDCG